MQKREKIVVLIGIILLIAGPVLGFFLDKLIVFSAAPATIQETSDTDIQNAFAFPVGLTRNQKLVIEFSVYYSDISATIKILGKGAYDTAYAANANPNPLGGESFVYSQFNWGQEPYQSTQPTTSLSITEDGYYYIEFAGSTNGDYLISEPGNYVVVIYGTNGGSPTEVYFNVTLKIDGPGEFLQNLLLAVGIIILVCFVLYFSYGYLNKLRRGIE